MNKLHKRIIWGLILALSFWLWVFDAFGATYYMRADGTAANKAAASGSCSTVGNCMSIATHDADTYSVGDTIILCDDGGVFRDQMDIPSSGSVGSVITYQAESGDSPIISGADLVSTWTEATIGITTWMASAVTVEDDGSTNANNMRLVIGAAQISTSGTKIRVLFEAQDVANDLVLAGASIGPISGSGPDFASAPTRITFDTGNNGKTISAGSEAYSDWIDFVLDEASTYMIHIYDSADPFVARYWKDDVIPQVSYYEWTDNDYTLTEDITADGSFSLFYAAQCMQVNASNIWQATVNTEPKVVLFNNTLGTKESSTANINASNEWFWSSNVLYVYSTSDPDTAYTTPGMQAGQRDYAIFGAGKTYISLNGIEVQAGNGTTYGTITAQNNAHNWTLVNIISRFSAKYGITIFGNTTNITGGTYDNNTSFGIYLGGDAHSGGTIDGITAHDNGTSSIFINRQNMTVQNSTFYHDGWDTATPAHALYLYNSSGIGANGTIVQNNKAYNYNGENDSAFRISGDNIIVKYNLVYDSDHAIDLVDSETSCDNNIICGNLFYSMDDFAIWIGGAKDAKIYNNTFHGSTYHTLDFNAGVNQNNSGNIVKNNIFYGATYHIRILAGQTTGFVSDYNLFDDDTGTKFQWSGSDYNFADWKTNSSQDTNSPTPVDPLFTNAAGDDFTLKFNSPCRHGAAYLSGYETKLRPEASWPDNVTTMKDILSIGAYGIYRGSAGM